MFNCDQYQLLDFGDGRRLESFGDFVLDRPCPAVEMAAKSAPGAWKKADAVFEDAGENDGRWLCRRELPDRWTVAYGPLKFELKCTPQGQVGLFPEQAENWDWIGERVQGSEIRARGSAFRVQDAAQLNDLRPQASGLKPAEKQSGERPRILNLFAYTGGSTLAAAAAGAEVVHVDAARNIVGWARRNAELSGLADAPIHWITEDAIKFVKRELKRGARYDAVILDPPSYGHGRRGEVWRLSKHLPQLLDMCGELTAENGRFIVLTCHTPGYECDRLADMLREAIPYTQEGTIEAKTLMIRSAAGRDLPSGAVVRWRAG
jgi:23S rRNA (cytosine1962-C5)-methyltransferase